MAYKDEYEVARLYSDGEFLKKLGSQFEGDYKLTFHLAPPLFADRDPTTGQLKKREYGAWMMPMFRMLASLKKLRGTALDIFGYTEERRMERRLIGEYEATIDEVLATLGQDNHALAVQIAAVPETMRGFGHIKEKNVKAAKEREASLLAAYRISPRRVAGDSAAERGRKQSDGRSEWRDAAAPEWGWGRSDDVPGTQALRKGRDCRGAASAISPCRRGLAQRNLRSSDSQICCSSSGAPGLMARTTPDRTAAGPLAPLPPLRRSRARCHLAAKSGSNTRPASPSTTSQALSCISRSSWPGAQPEWPSASQACLGPLPPAMSFRISSEAVSAMPPSISRVSLALVVGRMQHQAARGLDRAAEQHRPLGRRVRHFDAELLVDLAERQVVDLVVDDDAERAVVIVLADEDHALLEALVRHGGRGDQEAADQGGGGGA